MLGLVCGEKVCGGIDFQGDCGMGADGSAVANGRLGCALANVPILRRGVLLRLGGIERVSWSLRMASAHHAFPAEGRESDREGL